MDSDEAQIENSENWCPISSGDEIWMHARFDWLVETFGIERLWHAPFLTPCETDFPDPFSGTEENVRVLFSRICGYLDIDVNRLRLGFFSNDDPLECELAAMPTEAAGLYDGDHEKPAVWIARTELGDAESLVGTIAHELCHDILLGGGYLDAEEDTDHEFVTDLTTLYLGFGVFTSNSYLREKNWNTGNLEFSSTRQKGYLKLPQLGYGLALVAWHRNETSPEWAKALRPDLRDLVGRNLKFIAKMRGVPAQLPKSLDSRIGDHVRNQRTDELDLPELIVPENYETAEFTSAVRCVCSECHAPIQFPVELAGRIATCPLCHEDIDVPDLPGGRHEALVGQWNRRKQEIQKDRWAHHNLNARWQKFFLVAAGAFGIPWFGVLAGSISPLFLVGYSLGAVISVGFTSWWYYLKALEQNTGETLVDRDAHHRDGMDR